MRTDSDIIFKRRSIRKYTGESNITKEVIDFILNAAMCAPSARNKQPWAFVVCQNKNTLKVLSERHPYGKMLEDASLAILVCGDKRLDDNESYLLQNCSAATQNLLLAAHSCGLGAVWLGVNPREERIKMCQELLSLPEYILPVSLISIGHPAEEKPNNNNFDPNKVHWERWME